MCIYVFKEGKRKKKLALGARYFLHCYKLQFRMDDCTEYSQCGGVLPVSQGSTPFSCFRPKKLTGLRMQKNGVESDVDLEKESSEELSRTPH